MNKANVFLLAVVSSLLTYISTATQPAACAEVAALRSLCLIESSDTPPSDEWAASAVCFDGERRRLH